MDSPEQRAEHARAIRALVHHLEARGGDVLAVIRGQLERFSIGVERYGALDLDQPHDWQLEEDEERVDVENYRAIRRTLARRGASRSSRRARPDQADTLNNGALDHVTKDPA